jgi:hypothetical protein
MVSSVWPDSGSSSCMPTAATLTWSRGNLPVRGVQEQVAAPPVCVPGPEGA